MQRLESEQDYSSINYVKEKGRIGILTGGGDVPGLNPAIYAVYQRAQREGYDVVGIRRGWGGLIDIDRTEGADNSDNFQYLTKELVYQRARTGGTFLHTSRTNPAATAHEDVPTWLRHRYPNPKNDLTPEVLKNLEWLGVDSLIAIGGDDTLSYAVRMAHEGVTVNAIPKTMDGDVPGTEATIGFSTCVSRTIDYVNKLRTFAGSHDRFLVVEVLGRYAGFTSLVPASVGVSHRNLIPEVDVPMERVAELLSEDRHENPSHYAILIVSEGVSVKEGGMIYNGEKTDAYGHRKLGGIGQLIASKLEELAPQYNKKGKKIDTSVQNLGYLVRAGEPDSLDSQLAIAYGNMAIDELVKNSTGKLMVVRKGQYGTVPIETVTSRKKTVHEDDYDRDRLHPTYRNYIGNTVFHYTSED